MSVLPPGKSVRVAVARGVRFDARVSLLDGPTTLITNRDDCYHMTQVMSRYECTACGRKTPNVERTCRKCGGEMENTAHPH